MLNFAKTTAGDLYEAAHRSVIADGVVAAPRGKETREVAGAILELTDPQHRLVAAHGRRLNPFLMLAEVLWMLSGRDDVGFVSAHWAGAKAYAPPNTLSMPDAYGPRLRAALGGVDQVSAILRLFEQDRETRRAFVSFWNPASDSAPEAFAVPCNIGIDFKLRSDGLRMTVFNRSNDLHIGFLFNLVQFGVLGEVIAAHLGVKLALQTHVTTSLHVYTESDIARRLAAGFRVFDLYSSVRPLPVGALDDGLLRSVANCIEFGSRADLVSCVGQAKHSPWLVSAILLLAADRALRTGEFDRAMGLLAEAPRSDWWILAAESFARRLLKANQLSAVERLARLVDDTHPAALSFVMAT